MEPEILFSDSPQNNPTPRPGFLTGHGYVRDKDGNVKGYFTINTPATPEQIADLKGEK